MREFWSVANAFANVVGVIAMSLAALMACFWWAFIPGIGGPREAAAKGAVALSALLIWGTKNFRKTLQENRYLAYGGLLLPMVVGCVGFAFGVVTRIL